jgi:hypothetical protein
MGKNVATMIGPIGKLDEKRMQQVLKCLLICVPKIKVEIRHRGASGIAQRHDIFYDRGADRLGKFDSGKESSIDEPEYTLP